MSKSEETRLDRLQKRFTDHPYWSVILFALIVLGAVFTFVVEPIEKIAGYFRKEDPGKIFVDCRLGTMPAQVPPEGRIYVLITNEIPAEMGGGGFGEYFARPGTEWKWSNDKLPQFAYRCEATNQSERVLLNAELAIRLIFRKPVPADSPNSLRQGETTVDRDWPVNIPKIDPAPASGFVFYIWNCCVPRFIEVDFPRNAKTDQGEIPVVEAEGNMFQALNPVPFEAAK